MIRSITRREWVEGDPCELCGEPPTTTTTPDDVLAEFWDPQQQRSIVCHGQCGIDAGLELA